MIDLLKFAAVIGAWALLFHLTSDLCWTSVIVVVLAGVLGGNTKLNVNVGKTAPPTEPREQ